MLIVIVILLALILFVLQPDFVVGLFILAFYAALAAGVVGAAGFLVLAVFG